MNIQEQYAIIEKHQEKAPVQVVPIARELGLEVFRVPGWKNDISGFLRREKSGEYAIYVNADHNERRRRFTIAHEIAHFMLHKDLIENGVVDDVLYRSKLNSNIEVQANRFAADILMPVGLVGNAISDKGLHNVDSLAEHFNVSKSSMSIRLGVPFES